MARPGEGLPGTTEVLESCFGKLKALEEGQSKGRLSSLCWFSMLEFMPESVPRWRAFQVGMP